MSRILIVEDEVAIADLEKDYLELSGFEVEIENDGKSGLERALNEDFDLFILDLMLPEVDGFEICKQIREKKNTPILMVSAKKDDIDKIRGLGLGADDYVTKPFSPKELVARVKAITKRYHNEEDKMIFGSLTLDDKAHEVRIDDKLVTLTPKEYDLLKCFLTNHHIALSREQLLTNIWGYDFYGDDRTVDTHVKTLRQHLGKCGKYIKTIRKVGYKFEYED